MTSAFSARSIWIATIWLVGLSSASRMRIPPRSQPVRRDLGRLRRRGAARTARRETPTPRRPPRRADWPGRRRRPFPRRDRGRCAVPVRGRRSTRPRRAVQVAPGGRAFAAARPGHRRAARTQRQRRRCDAPASRTALEPPCARALPIRLPSARASDFRSTRSVRGRSASASMRNARSPLLRLAVPTPAEIRQESPQVDAGMRCALFGRLLLADQRAEQTGQRLRRCGDPIDLSACVRRDLDGLQHRDTAQYALQRRRADRGRSSPGHASGPPGRTLRR